MPTPETYGTGCIGNDGGFFIFGGGSFIQIYNAIDNSWTTVYPSGPSIDDFKMSCAVDSSTGLMYLTGGKNDGTRFYSYNVSSNTITNLSTSSSPTPFNLYGQGSFVNNGKLYVFGGYDDSTGNYSSSTYIYDIANNSWSTGRNMTQAVFHFGYATDGSRFYVIGGGYGNNVLVSYTQVYDISSGNWSVNNGTVYSGGIEGNAAVFLDGSLHSIGGYDGNFLSIHLIASLCGVYVSSRPCDDLNQCTFNDTCQSNGSCMSTSNVTCPTPSNECQSNICNSIWGCDIPTGIPCNSSNNYLLNTVCSFGQCIGQPVNGKFSLSVYAIVGIAIASLFLVVIITVAIVFLLKYLRRKKSRKTENAMKLDSIPHRYEENAKVFSGTKRSNYSITPSVIVHSSYIPNANLSLNTNNYILKLSDIKIKRKIGEGAFGCVYLGILNRIEVALKKLSKTNVNEEDIKEFMAEARIMRNLPPHPNVVMLRGITLPPDPLSIITDYCNGGSLSEYLKDHRNIPISEKIQFIKDIAKGKRVTEELPFVLYLANNRTTNEMVN